MPPNPVFCLSRICFFLTQENLSFTAKYCYQAISLSSTTCQGTIHEDNIYVWIYISNLCHYTRGLIFVWAFPHFGYFHEKQSFRIYFWSLVESHDLVKLHNTPFVPQPKVHSEPIQSSNDLKLFTFSFGKASP